MTDITIEKGIPMPGQKAGKPSLTGALRSMNVGDSFVVPSENRKSVYSAARLAQIAVASRTISATEVRIWRTA